MDKTQKPNMKYVWVSHSENSICLYPQTAKQLDLEEGQKIDDVTFWEAIRLNGEIGISLCRSLKEQKAPQ